MGLGLISSRTQIATADRVERVERVERVLPAVPMPMRSGCHAGRSSPPSRHRRSRQMGEASGAQLHSSRSTGTRAPACNRVGA